MENISKIDRQAFMSSGYQYFPGWLSKDEIDNVKKLFNASKDMPNANYSMRSFDLASSPLQHKIEEFIMELNNSNVGTQVNLASGIFFYDDVKNLKMTSFNWHQDVESFLMLNNHKDFVNVYICIEKDVPEIQNLDILPLDKMPKELDFLIGSGATGLSEVEGRGVKVTSVDRSIECFFPGVSIEKNFVRHFLKPGDMLAIRGDVIHRSQPKEERVCNRISLSIRLHSRPYRPDPLNWLNPIRAWKHPIRMRFILNGWPMYQEAISHYINTQKLAVFPKFMRPFLFSLWNGLLYFWRYGILYPIMKARFAFGAENKNVSAKQMRDEMAQTVKQDGPAPPEDRG